jgi:L-Ala-D/L-Glu epimerase
MKIRSIKTKLQTIPLKTPFITALRRVENVEFVRVFLMCENGEVGIGEAPATKAITGEDLDDIVHSIECIQESLLQTSPAEALEILHASSIGSSAKAALDIALVSLLAGEKKQKLFEYFGAKEACILQTDITVSLKNQKMMLEDSVKFYEEGMDILKVKLGSDIAHAIQVTHSISKRLPDAKLIIDANQAWSVQDSLKFIQAMQNVKIELIEQPVEAKDMEGLKAITQISHIPILADEAVFTLEDAKKVIETKSADMINIKLMKCGGLSQAVAILDYAKKMGVKCMLGSMLEGPYSINAALHLAMAYTDVIAYIDLDSPLLYKEVSQELEFMFDAKEIRYIDS